MSSIPRSNRPFCDELGGSLCQCVCGFPPDKEDDKSVFPAFTALIRNGCVCSSSNHQRSLSPNDAGRSERLNNVYSQHSLVVIIAAQLWFGGEMLPFFPSRHKKIMALDV